MILDYLSTIISLIALIISMLNISRVRADSVREFFYKLDSEEAKEYRRTVYNIRDKFSDDDKYLEYLIENPKAISQTISMYDYWAKLIKHQYLPLWAFKGMPGRVAVNFYKFAEPYIKFRRNKGYDNLLIEKNKNENFASNYEWLVKKIDKKKYQYKL